MKRKLLIFFCTVFVLTTPTYAADTSMCDLLYPVGSYYETSDASFDPSSIWGGTWVKETEGLVHVSSGTDYPLSGANANNGAGTKDGGRTDAIIVSHYHSIGSQTVNTNNNNATHQHYLPYNEAVAKSGSTSAHKNVGYSNANAVGIQNTSGATAFHTHTASIGAFNTGSTGTSDVSMANMMPYKCVIRWHRTA